MRSKVLGAAAFLAVVAVIGLALTLRYSSPSDRDLAADSCTTALLAQGAESTVTSVMDSDEFIRNAFPGGTEGEIALLRSDLLGEEESGEGMYWVELDIGWSNTGALLCLTSVEEGVADNDPLFVPADAIGIN